MPLLPRCTKPRFFLNVLLVLSLVILFPGLKAGFDGIGDNPSVFLRQFFQPRSIIRRLLWDVFIRNARGNKIMYISIPLIIPGNVIDLKSSATKQVML